MGEENETEATFRASLTFPTAINYFWFVLKRRLTTMCCRNIEIWFPTRTQNEFELHSIRWCCQRLFNYTSASIDYGNPQIPVQ